MHRLVVTNKSKLCDIAVSLNIPRRVEEAYRRNAAEAKKRGSILLEEEGKCEA